MNSHLSYFLLLSTVSLASAQQEVDIPPGGYRGWGPNKGDFPPRTSSDPIAILTFVQDLSQTGSYGTRTYFGVPGYPELPYNDIYIKYYRQKGLVLFLDKQDTWINAVSRCNYYGLQPTSYNSREEFNYHVAMLNDNSEKIRSQFKIWNAWTGGNDIEQEGYFNWWYRGQSVPTPFYGSQSYGQPDNFYSCYNNQCGDEDCVEFWWKDGEYRANDRNCLVPNLVMCKEGKIPK